MQLSAESQVLKSNIVRNFIESILRFSVYETIIYYKNEILKFPNGKITKDIICLPLSKYKPLESDSNRFPERIFRFAPKEFRYDFQ